MASFTEQATLKVVDQSSGQLRKINAELRKLFATASRLKSISVDIRVNTGNLQRANAQLSQLARTMSRVRSQSVNVRVNQQGLTAANAAVARMHAQAARPVVIRTQHAGAFGGAGAGATRPGPRYGGGGPGRTAGGAFLGGFGGGIGVGLGRLNESFGMVALAAYAAARGLKAISEAALERDRAQLAVSGMTSKAQQDVFKQLDDEAKARKDVPPALRYKKDQFDLARASFLGDVGNSEDLFKTPEQLKSVAAQQERAVRADILARKLYQDVVPGMYMRNPKLTQEAAQEDLLKLVQTLGVTTDKMFERDSKGQQVLSQSALRVLEGISLAQRGAPDLTMQQIKMAAASIKSLGYTATAQQIAETLFNVSARGSRAANEAYQMYRTGLGTVDIAKLNKAIFDLGGFIEGTAQKSKKGIAAGTGIPVEFTDPDTGAPIKLSERPSEWWRQLLKQPAALKKQEDDIAKQAAGALGPKATAAQRKKAADDARQKFRDEGATPAQDADFVNRTLAGARNTALQGILDAILGGPIAQAGLAQAAGTPGPAETAKIMAEAWSVQLTNASTELSNAAATFGQGVASFVNATGILSGLTNFTAEHPYMAVGAMAVAVGGAMAAAVGVPFATLTAAGTGLMGAAGALTNAAAALGGAGVLPGGAGGAAGGAKPSLLTRGAGFMRGAGIAAVAVALEELVRYVATTPAEQQAKDMAIAEANKEIQRKEQRITALEIERAGQEGIPQTAAGQALLDKQKDEITKLRTDIQTLRDAMKPKPEAEKKPGEEAKIPTAPTPAETTAAITTAVKDYLATQPKPDVKPTTPTPTPSVTSTAPTTPAVAPDALAALIPQLAMTSQSITLAVSSLTMAGTTFSTVFQTGATAIGNSGQVAASTLIGAAPSIGAAIGAAAANAISAAAANITVNVNANVKGAPTGTSKPD